MTPSASRKRYPEVPAPAPLVPQRSRRTIAWVVAALAAGTALVLAPFWAPLLLAAWTAELVRRPYGWLAKRLRNSHRGAAAVIVLLVVTVLVPMTLIVVSLGADAVALIKRAIAAGNASSALRTVVSSGADASSGWSPKELFDLAQQYGAGMWQVAQSILSVAVGAVVGAFLFLFGVYEFLVEGRRISRWMYAHSPIASRHLSRLSSAFNETGRGLFIGVGLTALAQGVAAMIGYFALGIPQAAVLGLLTCVASLVPSFGSGLVWVPVTAGLALTGRPGAAVVMGAIGLFVSTVDNFLRPALSRFGRLEMSSFLLLVSTLGGLAVAGAWGLVIGPLVVRLAIEGMRILREERMVGPERDIALAPESSTSPPSD